MDETWAVDQVYFYKVAEATFMEKLREFPVLYDTASRKFKNARTTKRNALRTLAKGFRGTEELVSTRFSTVRTRIGRYLKQYR